LYNVRKKKRENPVFKNVPVVDVAAEGKSIAKADNLVIFVSNAVPGDIIDIQVTRKKKSYFEGRAIHFHKYSDKRATPVCEHFGVCGGCKRQDMAYEAQLYYKQKQVEDNLKRIGKINLSPPTRAEAALAGEGPALSKGEGDPAGIPCRAGPTRKDQPHPAYAGRSRFGGRRPGPDTKCREEPSLEKPSITSGSTFEEEARILPIIPSKKTEFYRNKLEFTFSNKRWLTEDEIKSITDPSTVPHTNYVREVPASGCSPSLRGGANALGFHIPQRFDKVLDIKHCHLQKDPSNAIRLAVKDYATKNKLSFFDIRKQEGFCRNLIIRTSTTGEIMVILSFFHEDVKKREGLLNHLADKFPEITSLMYVINPKKNDTISDLEVQLFSTQGTSASGRKGRDHIYEEMEGLKFKIGPKSFYQTNSEQAYELYKVIREFAQLTGDEIVYDLYTGSGTIANFIARQAKKVIGIEFLSEAIEDAKINSEVNGIANTSFYAGDIKDIFNDGFIKKNGNPDMIITDPPRAGMHKDVVEKIVSFFLGLITYIREVISGNLSAR